MKKIKIALLGSFPIYPYRNKIKFWNNRKNLVTSWNYNLAYALAKNPELEVHFFCNASLWKTEIYTDKDLHIHFIGHPPRLDILNRLSFMQFSNFQIQRLLNKLKPDLVHGIGTDHEYAYIAVKSGYPNVVTVHGVMKQIVEKYNSPWYSSFSLFAIFESLAIQKTKHIISINPYVSEQFDYFKGQFHQIENSISADFFSIPSKEEYDLCFIGMYNKGKRLLNVISALQILRTNHPDIKLKIIGNPLDLVYDQEIKKFIQNNNLEHNVKFLGQLEQKEVATLLAQSKMLVVPSIQETAPMVIAEAMALGKAIVATNVGGIKYMVQDGITGFVIPPDNIHAIVEKVNLLLLNKNLRLNMGKNAKELAQKTYHPDIVAKKTYQVYKNILSQKEV
ncbi:MAG: glycosyltransferase family 4 protein [Bacteroidales bacterium]|nr:glycosyltransferase family 4 protein [Bacteroidales bacterium]